MTDINIDNFDWKFYSNYYDDLRVAGIDNEKKALDHYYKFGFHEKRIINPCQTDPELKKIIEMTSNTQISSGGKEKDNSAGLIDISHFKTYINQVIKVKGNHIILEIGCGFGDLTTFLKDYLDENGKYYGFDLDRKKIESCRLNISNINPNLTFNSPTSKNNVSTPDGLPFSHSCLPYENAIFDFVIAPKFFINLTPIDMQSYLSEVSRVLKVGGKFIVSNYIWVPIIERQVKTQNKNIKSIRKDNKNNCVYIVNIEREQATAYHESTLFKWHQGCKLEISKILYGCWSGYLTDNTYQDIILSERKK